MEEQLRILKSQITQASEYLTIKQAELLKSSYNKFVISLQEYLKPVDDWQQDAEFLQILVNFEGAVFSKQVNANQRFGIIADLKTVSSNDIEKAKQILILSTKYGSPKFENSLAEVEARAKKTKPKESLNKTDAAKTISEVDIMTFATEKNIVIEKIDLLNKTIHVNKDTSIMLKNTLFNKFKLSIK